MQERDWRGRSAWLRDSFADLARHAAVFLVPVDGGSENLAVTGLELISGVLRKGTSARYRATVRNCGTTVAQQVRVNGRVNNITVDVKVIPAIAPGTAASVSLFLPFRDAGPVRLTAELSDDPLTADKVRRAVAVIRDRVSVLCVQGSAGESRAPSGPVAAAHIGDGERAEAANRQSEAIAALMKAEFRLRVGAEREALAKTLELIESREIAQKELRMAVSALDEKTSKLERAELAGAQAALHPMRTSPASCRWNAGRF